MKMKEYEIKDIDIKVTVWESKTQKEILDVLDELLENDKEHPEWNVFSDEAIHILYNDGTTYDKLEFVYSIFYKF
jgi:hypothetical protein